MIGSPISTGLLSCAASHWVAALAVKTKATTAPSKARTFHPPCQRGREGRTYPGGAVVPLFIRDLLGASELYISRKIKENQYPRSWVRSSARVLSALLNCPIQPLSLSLETRSIVRIRRATESRPCLSVRMSLSAPTDAA